MPREAKVAKEAKEAKVAKEVSSHHPKFLY